MKKIIVALITLLITNVSFSQVNTNFLGQLDVPDIHSTQLNDVWGYVDEDGNEYALVGARHGTSVVDVTDPTNPVEVFWEQGMFSVWRDIKTFGDYAYVTTEAENGLLIIDLGPLPQSTVLPTYFYNGPVGDEWSSAHNLYVDDATGFAYIFGANRDNGGMIILNLNPNPTQPVEAGKFESWYCHDGFVRNDTAFLAHISDGIISMVDVTDPANPVLLGTATTPTNLSHNIWSTDDNNYAYTTDEVQGGFLTGYDVSNPANITEIDKTKKNPEDNIIPHNTHVLGDYLVTSYYTAGVLIHDITQKNNIIEVGSYDTSPLTSSTYDGCWGAYPYLPSGNILATDMQEGLFIIGTNYQQAAYLEGNVKRSDNNNNITDVKVKILGGTNNDKFTNLQGNYTTGTLQSGTYDVGFYKAGYDTLVVNNVNLTQGNVFTLDTVLDPIPTFPITINVYDDATSQPIQGAQVKVVYPIIDYLETTNGLGTVDLDLFYEDEYEVSAGKWGYKTECTNFTFSTTNNSLDIYLTNEYYDDFALDFNWSEISTADRGDWVRVVPIPVFDNTTGVYKNPLEDVDNDCSNKAYLTGNGPLGMPGGGDVKNGTVILISPVFDLTNYSDPYMSLSTFFFNFHGDDPPNDSLKISLSNGNTIELIDFKIASDVQGEWVDNVYKISDYITPTAFMQVSIILSDFTDTENIAKGGVDRFHITDGSPVNVEEYVNDINLYPNPVNDQLFISNVSQSIQYSIYNLQGQKIVSGKYENDGILINSLNAGAYIIKFPHNSYPPMKFIKK